MNGPSIHPSRCRGARGSTLIEALVALALVAWAFLGVGELFLTASGLVRTARSHTAALAVARSLLEDLAGGGFDGTWERLGADGTAARVTSDSRTSPWARSWQRALDAALGDGWAEIEVASVAPAPTAPLRDASAIRVRVTVAWTDGSRPRRVRITAVRT
jgi:type II secretory pathway pseudopilin PulG